MQKKKLTINDLFSNDYQLASPPLLYFKLKKSIDDPDKPLQDAALIIEKDASLTLKLLKIVNSAFYGFPSKITSITQAIGLIGTKELQSIVLSTIVIEKFSDFPDALMTMQEFWERSLRCALIAQGIDRYLNKRFSDSIFTCGILHNVGQLVLFRRLPELSREVNLSLAAQEHRLDNNEIQTEQNIIGFDHYQVGAALSRLWKLPEIITQSIELHSSSQESQDFYELSEIIKAADHYSRQEYENIDTRFLGISELNMNDIMEQSLEELDEIVKVFMQD